jgi:hypothetical protein
MFSALVNNTEDDHLSRYLRTSLQTGGDIGYGTRYIGMGGRMDVQYGGHGARCATAYIYGMGVELGIWDKIRERAESGDVESRLQLDHAIAMTHGVPENVMEQWSQLGREYASKWKTYR